MTTPPTICVILPPSIWDKTQVLRAMTLSYAGGFMKHGLRPILADMDEPRFVARLAGLLRRPDIVAVSSVASWGIDTTVEIRGAKRNLIAHSGKPFIGHHGDYPFSPWVVKKLKHNFPRRTTLFNDPHSARFAAQMIPPRGANGYAAQAYCDLRFDPRTVTPPSRRPIPLLYSGKHLTTSHGRDLVEKNAGPEHALVYDAICEQGLHEYRRPFPDLCAEVYVAHNMPFLARDRRTWSTLYYAYERILSRRREILLAQLERHPMHLVVSGSGDRPPQHPRSVVHGPTPFPEVLKMLERTRAIVVAQPNYSHGITERTLTAMHRRAVVLSTPNAFLDENFVAGEDYLQLDGDLGNLDEQIASLDDAGRTDAIAESAWRKVVGRFSPEASVARYLEFIDVDRGAAPRRAARG